MKKSAQLADKDWSAVEARQDVNEKLSSYAEALEQRNRELQLLRGLGTLLQSCLTVEESQTVIARMMPKLFPTEFGTLYLLNARHQTFEPVVAWGGHFPAGNFSPQTAEWSLVQERSFSGERACFPVLCPDRKEAGQDSFFCAPIVGQRETLGFLYIQFNQRRMNHSKRQLAVTAAETIAMFLTNIKLREHLYEQTIHDPLTGLLNRRLVFELLEKELLRTTRKKLPLGVIMIDIDHFKTINDTNGHGAGDAVLRGFGLFFQKHIRQWDIACRYGGDEFLLVLTEASLEHVLQRADLFCKKARLLEVHYGGRQLDPPTLSLGVAVCPEHGQTAQELLSGADAALYQAKSGGRNRIATARPNTIAAPLQQL